MGREVKKTVVDEANSKRPPAVGKTVKVRALQRGQYGRPVSNLIEEGTVFQIAVADLEPYDATLDAVKQIKDDGRRDTRLTLMRARATITVNGAKYLLPTWVEDASAPVAVEAEDVDEPDPPASDDVL